MKRNYINIGCGNRYNKEWTNIDMVSKGPEVIEHNILEGIPFQNENFEVVYHSQVLEHFPKEKAKEFITECHRILKKNGLIRIVVPDLENIVDEYKKWLDKNLENPDAESAANYDWIMLELFDQTVRNETGGQMVNFFKQEEMVNERYVIDRIGYIGRSIRNRFLNQKSNPQQTKAKVGLISYVKNAIRPIKREILKMFSNKEPNSTEYKLGKFRLGGEVHMWMYDRYSLSRLLKEVGFRDIQIKTPFESSIPKWEDYELDVKDGAPFDPTSLFIEAKK